MEKIELVTNQTLLTEEDSDEKNAWLYILFVLMFYAFSIVVLMVKYIRYGH